MMEIITKDKEGKEWSREVEEGQPLELYGDEVEITVFPPKKLGRHVLPVPANVGL